MSKKISEFQDIAASELNEVDVPCIVKDNSEKYTNKKIKIVDYFVTKTDFDNKIDKNIAYDKVIVSDDDGKIIASTIISVEELNCLENVKDNIQNQLDNLSNNKLDKKLDKSKRFLITNNSGEITTSGFYDNLTPYLGNDLDNVIAIKSDGEYKVPMISKCSITTAELSTLQGMTENISRKFDTLSANVNLKLNKNLGKGSAYLCTNSAGDVVTYSSAELNLMKLPKYKSTIAVPGENILRTSFSYTATSNGIIMLYLDLYGICVKCIINEKDVTLINGGIDRYQNGTFILSEGDTLRIEYQERR